MESFISEIIYSERQISHFILELSIWRNRLAHANISIEPSRSRNSLWQYAMKLLDRHSRTESRMLNVQQMRGRQQDVDIKPRCYTARPSHISSPLVRDIDIVSSSISVWNIRSYPKISDACSVNLIVLAFFYLQNFLRVYGAIGSENFLYVSADRKAYRVVGRFV